MITIRQYEANDFDALCLLNRECYEKHCSDEELREHIAQGRTWIAEIDSKIIGCLVSYVNKMPYIWSVCIDPEHRRRGIATRLIDEFEKGHTGSFLFGLHVRQDNPAQKLYFDLGYRVVQVAKDFYGEQQDGLVMIKRLI